MGVGGQENGQQNFDENVRHLGIIGFSRNFGK